MPQISKMALLDLSKIVPCTLFLPDFVLCLKQVRGWNSLSRSIQSRSSPGIQSRRRRGGTGMGDARIRLSPVRVVEVVHGFPSSVYNAGFL